MNLSGYKELACLVRISSNAGIGKYWSADKFLQVQEIWMLRSFVKGVAAGRFLVQMMKS